MLVVEKGMLWLLIILSMITITLHATEIAKKSHTDEVDECPGNRVNYYLYTKLNTKNPIELSKVTDFNYVKFANTYFLKILIHELDGSYSDEFNRSIRNAYFEEGQEYNIISVQYHWHRSIIECFNDTEENVKVIAKCTAILLNDVLKKINNKSTTVHAIGFGVGAQIVGSMGKLLQTEYGITLNRATGLDPALCDFESIWNNLDTNSATFVDIIHTNSGFFGQLMANGTVDFYANGGFRQPGCNNSNWQICSHNRAYKYFAESIYYKTNDYAFFAKQYCTTDEFSLIGSFNDLADPLLVGEFCNPESSGIFNFNTNIIAPYTDNFLLIPKEVLDTIKRANVRDIVDVQSY